MKYILFVSKMQNCYLFKSRSNEVSVCYIMALVAPRHFSSKNRPHINLPSRKAYLYPWAGNITECSTTH